jgi:hypothetical protein
MLKLLLQIFETITFFAAWLGPIVLIWRFRAMGWLSGMFWFWWVSILWLHLRCDLDRDNYSLLYPQGDSPPLCEEVGYMVIGGWAISLIYCTLLLFAWVIVKVLIRSGQKLLELRRDRMGRR